MCVYNVLTELPQITEAINDELETIFVKYSFDGFPIDLNPIRLEVTQLVFGDLQAFHKEDPAAKIYGEVWCSLAFKAVRYYRYANSIYTQIANDEMTADYRFQIIREISENIKSETSVEIHPRATIGNRFIIDHGTHTVIGEACKIGDDCMILNNVVLGSLFDADTPPEDRQPKIGNKVKIYNDAKVLGDITIGDNCIIGSRCMVVRNMPPNSRVSIVNQLMIQRGESFPNVSVYGVVPQCPRTIKIVGKAFLELGRIEIKIVDTNFSKIDSVTVENCNIADESITFDIVGTFDIKNGYIYICSDNSDMVITDCSTALSKLDI